MRPEPALWLTKMGLRALRPSARFLGRRRRATASVQGDDGAEAVVAADAVAVAPGIGSLVSEWRPSSRNQNSGSMISTTSHWPRGMEQRHDRLRQTARSPSVPPVVRKANGVGDDGDDAAVATLDRQPRDRSLRGKRVGVVAVNLPGPDRDQIAVDAGMISHRSQGVSRRMTRDSSSSVSRRQDEPRRRVEIVARQQRMTPSPTAASTRFVKCQAGWRRSGL